MPTTHTPFPKKPRPHGPLPRPLRCHHPLSAHTLRLTVTPNGGRPKICGASSRAQIASPPASRQT
eukprot:6187243-Pleurochrysis_carterae.AAC.2